MSSEVTEWDLRVLRSLNDTWCPFGRIESPGLMPRAGLRARLGKLKKLGLAEHRPSPNLDAVKEWRITDEGEKVRDA
jgi:DNA-binding HxlR family transcriptional regulator